MLESSNLNYLDEYLICGSVALRDDVYYLSSTHPDVSNKYTIDTHKEGEHISVSKVHLVCRVMTLCVAPKAPPFDVSVDLEGPFF